MREALPGGRTCAENSYLVQRKPNIFYREMCRNEFTFGKPLPSHATHARTKNSKTLPAQTSNCAQLVNGNAYEHVGLFGEGGGPCSDQRGRAAPFGSLDSTFRSLTDTQPSSPPPGRTRTPPAGQVKRVNSGPPRARRLVPMQSWRLSKWRCSQSVGTEGWGATLSKAPGCAVKSGQKRFA